MPYRDIEAKRKYAREYNKRWRKTNPELARARDVHYRAKYEGKHQREYNERNLDARNKDALSRWHKNSERYRRTKYAVPEIRKIPNCCEGCGDIFANVGAACFDHDHKTGEFRGWLCNDCNLGLGFLKDDRRRILAIADYLDRYELTR